MPSMQRTAAKIVLSVYTSQTCSLCEPVKFVAKKVAKTIPGCEYEEVDIHKSGHEEYKNKYEFDIPVVEVNSHKVWGASLKEQKLRESDLRIILESYANT